MVWFYPANAGSNFPTHLATIALFDPEHGEPLAYMDGRLITEMRTAATSVANSLALANPESRVLALIGSGVQAEAHLAALREFFPSEDVRVWSHNADNAARFAATHGVRAASVEDAVQSADIVVCATNALEPVLRGEWLMAGAHVNSVGSPRLNWRELDDAVMRNLLVVDSRAAAGKEAGDIILSGASIYAEPGEILAGKIALDRSQTTVSKSVGMAVEDLATARIVSDRFTGQRQ